VTGELLKQLIAKGESLQREFKKALDGTPDSVYETICAFLNRKGGDVVLGVDDDGTIVGIAPVLAEKIAANIASTTNNSQVFNPPYLLYPESIEIDGKTVLLLRVPESSRVHRLRAQVYDRGADGDFKVLDPERIADLANRKRSYYSETKVYPYLKIEHLDQATIEKSRMYLRAWRPDHPWAALSTEDLLRKAGLILQDYESGIEGLTLAAGLLFGKEETIQSFVPQYKTDLLVRRNNVDRYDDRLDVRVNLIEAYSEILNFLNRQLPDPFFLEGNIRISLRDKIFRELVANILVHREYISRMTSRIIIYADRIEFENPCVPAYHGRITPDTSIPNQKNPLISKFFLQMGWVEEVGSGLINVTKYLPYYASGSWAEFIEDEVFSTIIHLTPQVTMQDTMQDTPQVTMQVAGERAISIVKFCSEPHSREEIQRFLGIKNRDYFRKEILNPLIEAGILESTIPDKPTSRFQKYKATKR